MNAMSYKNAKAECERIIEKFNECKAEHCGDCPLYNIHVAVRDGEATNACHLLAFYKRYLEDRIIEALN